MRSAKESDFPYALKTVCYIEVLDGNIEQRKGKQELEEAIYRVKNQKSTLYGVWPGTYQSDLFLIDDVNLLADAYGIRREDDHIHDVKWKYFFLDDGKSRYATIDMKFRCGCKMDANNRLKIIQDLYDQKGWVLKKTGGYGVHGLDDPEYTVEVLRSTLQ